MAALDQIALRCADDGGVHSPATNTAAIVTLPAKAGYCWVVLGYTMSTDGVLAAATVPDVVSGSLVVDRFKAQSGLSVDRVIEFNRGVKCPVGASVVATLPAAGAGISGTVVLRAFQIQN